MKEKIFIWVLNLLSTLIPSFGIIYNPKGILEQLTKARMNEQANKIADIYESVLLMEWLTTCFYVLMCMLLVVNILVQLLNNYDRIKEAFLKLHAFLKKLTPKDRSFLKSLGNKIILKIKNLIQR